MREKKIKEVKSYLERANDAVNVSLIGMQLGREIDFTKMLRVIHENIRNALDVLDELE
jgi:hypothetical protein